MELTVEQALTYCGVSLPTFTKQKLTHSKVGQKKMYSTKDLDKLIKAKKWDSPKQKPTKDELSPIGNIQNKIKHGVFDPQKLGADIFNENLEDFTKDTVEITKLCQSIAFNVSVRDFIENEIIDHPLDLDVSTLLGKYMQQYKLLLDSKKRLLDVQKAR